MKSGSARGLGAALFVAFAVAFALLVTATPGLAQGTDLTGTWTFEVTSDQGVTTPTVVIEQDGEALTGSYSSATLGEADISGTVAGSDITISFTGEVQGQAIPVTYTGTIGEDDVITGEMDIAGGMATGTFTATKNEM